MTSHQALLTAGALLLAAPSAQADINDWLAAVAAGTAAGYVTTGIVSTPPNPVPITADIGSYNAAGGVSYEFIVNAANAPVAPGGSSALMGVRNFGGGTVDLGGIKFEQWFQSQSYGLTNFGVADYFYSMNVENTDVHLVFVADPAAGTTELFVDAVSQGTAPYAPVLSGIVGLGQAWDPIGLIATDELAGTIHGIAVYDMMLGQSEIQVHHDAYFQTIPGTNYCGPAIPNSSGFPGRISATGSSSAAANNFSLVADQLPPGQFGYFLAGQTQGFFNPAGSQGIICLMGNIGRYNQVANIIQGPMGSIQLDLTAIPVNPPQAVQPGETWNFQCWFRDNNPTLTNNFTDGLSVMFL